MKIYDCITYFDESTLFDLRLNILDKYVDKFVITEATYMHSGRPKKLVFDINKFSKFKDKIIYNVVDKEPSNIEKIYEEDNDEKFARALGKLGDAFVNEKKMADAVWSATIVDKK